MNRNFNTPVNDKWKYFQTVISCILNSHDLCSAVTYYITLLYIYKYIVKFKTNKKQQREGRK